MLLSTTLLLGLLSGAGALPGHALQPDRSEGIGLAASASAPASESPATRKLSRRRYGGELKRDISLWAEMARRTPTARPRGASQLIAANISLPKDFTWADHNGINFLTPQRNQHIPRCALCQRSNELGTNPTHSPDVAHDVGPSLRCADCGSCWAFASTSVLADRWNVKQHKENPSKAFQPVLLSVQSILSCGNELNGCGTCEGGDDAKVYELAATHGLVHQACSEYMAMDTKCGDVIGFDHATGMESRPPCYNCDEKNRCWVIQNHKRLWSTQAYAIDGEEAMMQEIREHGPIACAIMATDKMEHDFGPNCMSPPPANSVHAANGAHCITGTFMEALPDSDARINHVVEVVGWGTDQHNNDYWTIRNSWGTEWGDQGFMNIVRDSNKGPLGNGNNLLETQCGAARVLRYE